VTWRDARASSERELERGKEEVNKEKVRIKKSRVCQVKNEVQWEARHFGPLSFSVFLTIFFVGVERNLQLFGSASDYFELGTQWRWLLNDAFTFSFLSVYALRAWIVHFDYHTGLAMLAQLNDWDNYTLQMRERVEWFILNRTLYGSPRYLTQFFIVIVIVMALGIWGWIVVSPDTYYYGIVAIYAGIMLVIMTVTQKITVINDFLFIRHELLLEFRILAAFFVLLGFLIIFGAAMNWHYCIFFVVEASAIAMTGMGTIATWWMLDKSMLFNFPLLKEKRLKLLGKEDEKENEGKRVPPLRAVINDEEASVFFFRHLVRELSLENVFFLADIMRYKNSFVQPNVLDSVPGFSIQIRDLAKHSNVSGRTLVQYAWALGQAYVENISASYVTAIHQETRDQILEYLEKMETKKRR